MNEETPPVRILHDRLFKELLYRFLPEFLRIFFPAEAERLNFATLKFLDKELVINFPGQELRITDIVAEVETWEGVAETVILHVEIEARDKRTLPQRMSEYYVLLRVLRQRPVLPLALVLLPRSGWSTLAKLPREHLRPRGTSLSIWSGGGARSFQPVLPGGKQCGGCGLDRTYATRGRKPGLA